MIGQGGRRTGYKLLLTKWLLADFLIAAALTFGLKIDGFEFADKALFPAASILVGMAVAWTARASFIINDYDFRNSMITKDNPIEDYVYGYQLSILILFVCIVYVAIMAAGGFNFHIYDATLSAHLSSFFMYFLMSVTIRECWSVINFTNMLSLLNAMVKPNSTKD